MKKFLWLFSSFLLVIILSFLLLSYVYETRFINVFKKQIIEKTDINLDFDDIHFSILRHFPYGSFLLDDAKIFYSMHNRKDTLLRARKLFFKINAKNLFNDIYEFPEIIVSDGSINIKGELLDTLLKSSSVENQNTAYRIETESIKIFNCNVKYSYENSINLYIYSKESTFSGSFLPASLSFKIHLNINRFKGRLNNFTFQTNDYIEVSSTIMQKDFTYFSENGKITKGKLGLGFSFRYNTKTDYLQIKTFAEKMSAQVFYKEFFKSNNIQATSGHLSFESLYSINFKISKSQKLLLNYSLDNLKLKGYEKLSIVSIKGKTTITDDFSKNHSEIENYLVRYNGFEFLGSSLIKNFPRPTILINSKMTNHGEMQLSNGLSLKGKLWGSIKALVQIDDFNKLDYKYLKILKIQSDLKLENISINSVSQIKDLSGYLKLHDDVLSFNGRGALFDEEFKGNLDLPEFMNFIFHGAKPNFKIFIEMNKLNLDSVRINKSTDTSFLMNYELKSKIKSLKYKGISISDLEINLINKNERYNCDYIRFKAFKGLIFGNFSYCRFEQNSLSITGQELNIQDLFKDFNSFGQTIVREKNISGSISGKVDMSFRLLNSAKIDPLSIKLSSNIVIENGVLSAVSHLERLSKFLNISEVDSFRFKTIQNKIDIEKGVVRIPSMDISSNALNFQVFGKHGFNGEFSYWIKLNLKELLAKKFLLTNTYSSDYEKDNKNGLNLFLKIYGNNESYKVAFDKKSSIEHFKSNLNQEGILLKSILKEEFGLSKKKSFLVKDSTSIHEINKVDSAHNKNQKKTFKIEWEEIDTTMNNNK